MKSQRKEKETGGRTALRELTMKKLILTSLVATALSNAVQATPLTDAINDGHFGQAMALITDGTGINDTEANGTTPLHWAVYHNNLALVEALIDAGADVNAVNKYGSSPMTEAATLGDYAIMKALLDAGADVDAANEYGQTALMVVVRSDNVDTARLLIQHGANVHAKEQWQGQNAVIFAAAQAQPEMLKLLMDAGADPNSRSLPNERDRYVTAERRFQWRPAGGIPALGYAAREGCLSCTEILVEAGADLNLGDAENVTPLNLAIMNLHFDTAKYLIEAGADVDKWSLRGENPLYSAVDMNTLPHGGYPDRPSMDNTSALDIIAMLLDEGANPNLQLKLQPTYRSLKDDRGADRMLSIGATALLRAAKGHDVDAIRLLVEHGARIDLPNKDGTTPLMAAAGLNANSIDTRGDYTTPLVAANASKTIDLLVASGADLEARDQFGRTALHGAASWGWNDAVKTLINHGADMQAQDMNGLTPFDYAMGERSGGFGRGVGGDVHQNTADLLQELMLANR